MKMTMDIARSAAWDVGNRSMVAGGRTTWSDEDFQAACEEFDRLLPLIDDLDPQRFVEVK